MINNLYNPLMPDLSIAGRVAFGGGGGGGGKPAPVFKSNLPELSGRTYSSQAELNSAEATVTADRAKVGPYKTALNNAVASVDKSGKDAIGVKQAEILAAQQVPKPSTTYKRNTDAVNKALSTKVNSLQKSLQKVQADRQQQLGTAQRDLVSKSLSDPSSLVEKAEVATTDADTAGTSIAEGTGELTGAAPQVTATTVGTAATADVPDEISATSMVADTAAERIEDAVSGVEAAQGRVSAESLAQAATTEPTDTAVSDLKAEQGQAILMQNPTQREIQQGELISGVADAQKAVAFTEQVQAAQATPSEKTMVQNQLSELMQDFEGGNTPAWAAGAMRNATAQMAARGLGASSMAGQAIVQAAMESALPIAVQDAQTQSQFELQNLSNRQQRAMLAAQQRADFIGMEFTQDFQARVQNAAKIADVANLNFTAEQQVALENSRIANTVELTNLSNRQAVVMAEAAAISQLEQQNLSNQQQAAVQNAQAFLQMDMANLNNEQQTTMFKAQSVVQSLFTDQAAENAARQINAQSENQTKQLMANLKTQVQLQNAAQINNMNQFNAGQENAAETFNAQIQNQRDQFNAQNQLVIAQANAQWRQNVATINTAAQNEANMQAALTANQFTQSTLDQVWQRERDLMDYAYKAAESEKDRALEILIADKKYDEYAKQRSSSEETAKWALLASALF